MAEVRIRVAVRLRPLLPRELLHAHRECLRVIPGAPQVILGSDQLFSFDHAFGPSSSQHEVYESCVRPLTRGLLDGTNATVFCYGQTGSGKTYTLGGNKMDADGGIISCFAKDVFSLLDKKKQSSSDGMDATVRLSYLELYKEELRDLLELDTSRKDLHIRDNFRGNTVVVGAKEVVVSTSEELLNILEVGNALRQTGATGMNKHSSRSHTILTLWLSQTFPDKPSKAEHLSKFCVVDLAGSERVGKTGNTGIRFEESVHINTGLLALGNVIRALTNPGRQRSAYIPYRHAKITRLLRDSLGGNACTLLVACVSPSHHSFAESLSVLKFASKSRHIRHHAEVEAPDAEDSLPSTLTSDDPPLTSKGGDLDHEVQPLRPLLEQTSPRKDDNQTREASPYSSLVHQAAKLLAEVCGPKTNDSFARRVREWNKRLKAVSQSHHSEDVSWLEEKDLKTCPASVEADCQLQQKVAKLKEVQKEGKELPQKHSVFMQAFWEQKEQTERLVDQQILIDCLRCDLMTLRGKTCCRGQHGPHSASLVRPSCGHMLISKMHASLPAESLERLMATFKVSSHRLQSEEEMKDFCPLLKQTAEFKGQETKDGMDFASGLGWTSRQKKSTLKEKTFGQEQTSKQRPQQATRISEQCRTRQRASLTQRRIQMLSANMSLKEELVKEMEKTEKDTRAAVRHDSGDRREDDVLAWLSEQSRQGRATLRHSLQHMDLLRAQLQRSLRRTSLDSSDNPEEWNPGRVDRLVDLNVYRNQPQQGSKEQHECCWLEEAEELELQRRAKQQEMEEELRSSQDVLQRRDACLEQKNKLETARLRSSQALRQDLLRVSLRLETLEEKMGNCGGVKQATQTSLKELEKQWETLKKRRDCLDSQLKDNTVLTVEEEQLEEAVQVLDAALDFKERSIRDQQEKMASPCERALLFDITTKLRTLSQAEASELLVKYFNKVISLRQTEGRLCLYCEELEILCGEQEAACRQLEAALQHLALDADRRLTLQQQEHQRNIQLLLRKLKEGISGEAQLVLQDRLQNLEKELFFYKHCSRKLRKQLKESQNDAQPVTNDTAQAHAESKDAKTHAGQQQSPSSSSSSSSTELHGGTKAPAECHQISSLARFHGYSERWPPHHHLGSQTAFGLRRKKLRELSPADVQARDSVVDTGIEMLSDDSLDVSTSS
ncbi:kinesin-like protein KIF27 [Dunckerocampus dactyliophorus]|uniref:kinesin-like protein KIF27 n=1 Tax=Dunckerocampus dactyliophorus TaxID=161453 RepID=UPI00240513E1|nr:kinesin-like protein KIF27 [Dunckerocampus dactyliophorus]